MKADKEVLHQLARRIGPGNLPIPSINAEMELRVDTLAQKIIDLTAEKDGGEVLIEVVG